MRTWNSQINGQIISDLLLNIVSEAGKIALQIRKTDPGFKTKSGKDDIVTKADTSVSEYLDQKLHAWMSNIKIIDEESVVTVSNFTEGLIAVIDPIDGTTNFFDQDPHWGISIGFLQDGVLLAGIIFQPEEQKFFYAEKGKGAFLNDQSLSLTSRKEWLNSQVMFDFPYAHDKKEYDLTQKVINTIENSLKINKIQRLGSQVIEIMGLLTHTADAFFHLKTKPWDVAAAIAIVTEAGGKAYNLQGKQYQYFEECILLTNGHLKVESFIQMFEQVERTSRQP